MDDHFQTLLRAVDGDIEHHQNTSMDLDVHLCFLARLVNISADLASRTPSLPGPLQERLARIIAESAAWRLFKSAWTYGGPGDQNRDFGAIRGDAEAVDAAKAAIAKLDVAVASALEVIRQLPIAKVGGSIWDILMRTLLELSPYLKRPKEDRRDPDCPYAEVSLTMLNLVDS
jgi:hypothetical protein